MDWESGFAQKDEIVKFGNSNTADTSRRVILIGYVKSMNEGALPGSTVTIKGKNSGVVTNETGRYRIDLKPGAYTLIFQFVSMKSVEIPIEIYRNASMDVILEPLDINLDAVIVEAEPDRNVNSLMTGVASLGIKDIATMPSFMGEIDVLKSLQTLPGVSSSGEGSGGFNVRGGKADQNLILLNQGQMYNATHVLGFFSAFNSGTVENFSLYKGYIPAQFGGRTSSVLDVQFKKGNPDRFKFDGSIGFLSSRIVADGPLSKNTGLVLAGRTSYSNWILQNSKSPSIRGSNAYFNDFSVQVNQKIGKRNEIQFFGYNSSDYFQFSDNFSFDWKNRLGGLSTKFFLGDNFYLSSYFGIGQYLSGQTDGESEVSAKRQIGIDFFQNKHVFNLNKFDNNQIVFGLEFSQTHIQPESIRPNGATSGVISQNYERENGREISLFVSDEITINPRLSIAMGLRYTTFASFGPFNQYTYANPDFPQDNEIIDSVRFGKNKVIAQYDGFEPRLSLRYKLSEDQSLKASYTRLYQYQHAISNTIAPSPSDIWQMSNQFIQPIRSDNFSIGFFRNFRNNAYEFSFDVFYRRQNNLLDFVDFAQLIGKPNLETELIAVDGQSKGAEIYLHKKKGKWTGWISYTYSASTISIMPEDLGRIANTSNTYPANFDQPHNLSLISKLRLGRKSSFDCNFSYISGRPITAIENTYYLGPNAVPGFSDRNKYRIPDYIRFDIGFTVAENIWKNRNPDYESKRFRTNTTFSIYNLFARNNAYSVYFIRPALGGNLPEPHKFSVIGNAVPSISINFTF